MDSAAQGHDPAVCEEVERTYQAETTSQEILMHEYQAEIGRLRAEIERLRRDNMALGKALGKEAT